MQDIWFSTMREYGLKDEQMKALYQFNQQNRDPMPDGLTAEQKAQWDFSNGIQKMTQEDMDKIFEPGHPIWGVDMTQTIDRVKQTFDEFVQWMSSVQELRKVTDAYAELGELYEEQQFAELRKIAEAETDPEKKATKLKAIDDYMDNKTLAFMAAPQKEEDINRILHALTDTRKVEYWLKRTGDKLKQVKIAGTFVPEIYGFEKMLDEKYHKCKDIILLYFMQLIIYCDCHDPKSERRMQVLYFFRTMDAYIQNRLAPSVKEKTTQNLYAFLDQFIDKIPDGVNGATALQK
ncbi:MAG: hypothetical protein K2N48_13155 [Muribaculaceae bacterium]|nr:hypothetical protein [Muribaculaceae bacterium]